MYTLRLLGSAVLDGPDGPVAGRAALRQRLALLALLAVEHPRPVSRDSLVASLWPESDTGDARHLLRDSLYLLRSALGDDAVLSTGDDLRLNPAILGCDLWEFEAGLERGDPGSAVGLYHGPFLDGFHLSDAEEFEHWADGQRTRLARRYGDALEQLAEREMKGGNPLRAAEWWSRRAGADPFNSRIALRYMEALEAAGDRAGALRQAGAHSDLLRRELNAAPEREVLAFAERLRLESRPASESASLAATAPRRAAGAESVAPISPPPAGATARAPDPAIAAGRPSSRRGWLAPAAIAAAALIGLGIAGSPLSHARAPMLRPRRVAAAPFQNRTGRRDLDDLGAMAADWMIRGLLETPMVDPADLEAVHTSGQTQGTQIDPLAAARRDGAAKIIRGSYYASGDSVLFQAEVADVATGRVLMSFEPVGAPVEQATVALEALRQRLADGLSPLVNALNRGNTIDPDLALPRNLAAYREFLAGLKGMRVGDNWDDESEHYRRAARLDSTFIAPLIQLAELAMWNDQCTVTDSVGRVLEGRRQLLGRWNSLTIGALRARCEGRMAAAVGLLGQRHDAYPESASARARDAQALQYSNQPRASRAILLTMDPERDLGWWKSPADVWPRYWWRLAGTWHMVGGYREELEITDRWADSTDRDWQIVRGRALAGLGREREVLALVNDMAGRSVDSVAPAALTIAAELAAHGHPAAARAVAESMLARFGRAPDTAGSRADNVARAEHLLGRGAEERAALERVAPSDADTLLRLEAAGRIAAMLGDTARADRIDGDLASLSNEPLEQPLHRGQLILARAHLAAALGRREQAVARLREAVARGMVDLGASHAFHADPLLAGLRGYPPFDALLVPDN
ncbi:MAG: BTAD domain-containing putative transcriptional regulator [Gemmatimonadales bacterium]